MSVVSDEPNKLADEATDEYAVAASDEVLASGPPAGDAFDAPAANGDAAETAQMEVSADESAAHGDDTDVETSSIEGPIADQAEAYEQAEDTLDDEAPAEEPAEEIVEEPAPEIIEDVAEEAREDPAEEPPLELTEEPTEPTPPSITGEATLQDKLTDVRAKADEARAAKLRANVALYEGLSAAYDFALDAEDSPEEYLRLVEAQGLKIQLRSPMKPVVKLAFDGLCDDATIKQLEAILAWAFDEELPRGSLAERIEAAGGIGPILNGQARAA